MDCAVTLRRLYCLFVIEVQTATTPAHTLTAGEPMHVI